MTAMRSRPFVASLALLWTASSLAAGEVRVIAPPNQGAVPDAEVDGRGVIHLVYVSGENVDYVRSENSGRSFTSPVRVNSESGTVHPAHMFRGPDVAIGRDGMVHVVWYSNAYQRKLPKEQWGVQYTRWNPVTKAFEPTRNLNHRPSDNYSLAADSRGNVAVLWMAGGMFLTGSRDDGKTFAGELKVSGADTCECCASRALLGPQATLHGLYRDKTGDDRDMYLVSLGLDGAGVRRAKLSRQSWHINACPMTGAFLAEASRGGMIGAWEREGQIYFGRLASDGKLLAPGEVATPRMEYLRKFPAALAASDGTIIVAWKHGRTLEWQRYDGGGKPQSPVMARESNSPHRPAGVVAGNGDILLFP